MPNLPGRKWPHRSGAEATVVTTSQKSKSLEIEKHGLALALQAEIEAVAHLAVTTDHRPQLDGGQRSLAENRGLSLNTHTRSCKWQPLSDASQAIAERGRHQINTERRQAWGAHRRSR